MSYQYPYSEAIQLHVQGRISADDASRQERTAREVLRRLRTQPGVILADEVGMGKTFVALAVAVSVALSDSSRRPVVVMVPPALKEKWPADFELFKEKCLPEELRKQIRTGTAERAVQFLKLLDDPAPRRKSIIFVTHGAMSRNLSDGWVMLALIYQSLKGKWGADDLRKVLSKVLGELLPLKAQLTRGKEGVWIDLLKSHPSEWLDVLRKWDIDPEADDNPDTDDDPVPRAVWKALPRLDTTSVYQSLDSIPKRRSSSFSQRVRTARKVIRKEVRTLWENCVKQLKLKLPLLILDEAHHLKNEQTRLASLFRTEEAEEDADEITRGPLTGVFERMLFLTATPFQLGHGELCSVLERFGSISWEGSKAPESGKEGFDRQIQDLRRTLDAAQESALRLDTCWGRLRLSDLRMNGQSVEDVEKWWESAKQGEDDCAETKPVRESYLSCRDRMNAAQRMLKPWVIRHLKPRHLPLPADSIERRKRIVGGAVLVGEEENGPASGITLTGEALLPFLLAARASSQAPDSRPVFAEGLASSYEAFLHTRQARVQAGATLGLPATDGDDDPPDGQGLTDPTHWYLDQIEKLVPRGDPSASLSHPKIRATVNRVVDIWGQGEKVIVFCHYIATGKVLRQMICREVEARIRELGAARLGCEPSEVPGELDRIGKRFFDEDSPIRRACDEQTRTILEDYPALAGDRDDLIDLVRRNVRTPTFLVRFFPLQSGRLMEDAMVSAMDKPDRSGLTLRSMLQHFFKFLVERCGEEDRRRYIDAVKRIQTGSYLGLDMTRAFEPDELQGESQEQLIPNVRLVNGTTRQETRQRLMLTFNTPFYPEVLIASSVMAEGVDLHLNCRFVIHHDLCWNPSTLEQRTGRVDRIGAKAEHCGRPIHLFLPYIGETQDEKMYRVVMDRERWFKVVMGEKYKVDARTTDKLAERILLPESVATELQFRLEAD